MSYLAYNSKLYSAIVGEPRQELEVSSHTHSQEQRKSECMYASSLIAPFPLLHSSNSAYEKMLPTL